MLHGSMACCAAEWQNRRRLVRIAFSWLGVYFVNCAIAVISRTMFLAFHGQLPCSIPAGKLWTTAVLSRCSSHGITVTKPTIVVILLSKSLFPSDLLSLQ
jgi:hypothetical protein